MTLGGVPLWRWALFAAYVLACVVLVALVVLVVYRLPQLAALVGLPAVLALYLLGRFRPDLTLRLARYVGLSR